MSLFSAFGKQGLAALAQTFEDIGTLVAPLPEEEQELAGDRDHNQKYNNEEDEDDDYNAGEHVDGIARLMSPPHLKNNYGSNSTINNSSGSKSLEIPESPSSMVSIPLTDETNSENNDRSYGSGGASPIDSLPPTYPGNSYSSDARRRRTSINSTKAAKKNVSSPAVFLSNAELEKKVHQKYREQLELELSLSEQKFRELEKESSLKIQHLRERCAAWEQISANSTPLKVSSHVSNSTADSIRESMRDNDGVGIGDNNSIVDNGVNNNEIVDTYSHCKLCNSTQMEYDKLLTKHKSELQLQQETKKKIEHLTKALSNTQSEINSYKLTTTNYNNLSQELMNCIGREDNLKKENNKLQLQLYEEKENSNRLLLQIETLKQIVQQKENNYQQLLKEKEKSVSIVNNTEFVSNQKSDHKSDNNDGKNSYSNSDGDFHSNSNIDVDTHSNGKSNDNTHGNSNGGTHGNSYSNFGGSDNDNDKDKDSISQRYNHEVIKEIENNNQVLIENNQLLTIRNNELIENLNESVRQLKELEEINWQIKGESSELLYAYELEQSKVKNLEIQTEMEKKKLLNDLEIVKADRISIKMKLNQSKEEIILLQKNVNDNDMMIKKEKQNNLLLEEQLVQTKYQYDEKIYELENKVINSNQELEIVKVKLQDEIDKVNFFQSNDSLRNDSTSIDSNSDNNKAVKEMQIMIDSLYDERNNLEKVIDDQKKKITKLKENVDSNNEIIMSNKLELVSSQSNIDLLLKEKQDLLSTTDKLQKDLEKLQSQNQNLISNNNALSKKYNELQEDHCSKNTKIDALTKEISELQEINTQSQRSISNQKDEITKQLLLEINSLKSSAESAANQYQTTKQQLIKMEAENKQLHQVIKQLRQVRKNNQGESDSLIAERDELRINNTSLQEEIAKLQTIIDNNTTNTELISKFKSDIQSYQNKLITIEQLLDTNNKIISNLEKDNYEKTSNMEILKSDYLLLQQEAEQKSLELRNLKDAINEFEKEKLVEIERIKLNHVNNMNQLRNELELVITSIKNENNEKLLLQQQRTNYLLEQIQEHELFRRKAEIDLINEKKTMQRSLENALSQLQNSQNDVIDRATVASLVVSYFQKKRSKEVLDLIAKVLQFNDEQLIAVGLKVPPLNFLSSIITTVIGEPVPPPQEIESNNLAELWINFLIEQAETSKVKSPATSNNLKG